VFETRYSPVAAKQLRRMPADVAHRIMRRIGRVAADPHATDRNVARLRGRPEMRLRVGDWRVLFVIDDEARQLRVLAIAPRGSVYR